MEFRHIVVGTAGHIDHGKSALVEALTGTNPDRLEEEQRRGITIDLGFAFAEIGGIRFGFVDVPGHEKFVRNMLAGVGGIDVVLLVIEAGESIQPQTREHFEICRLLGISRGIVALTKSDLVDPETMELVRLEVIDYLRGSFLEGAPIVSVSARTGAGLEDLRKALQDVAASVPSRDASQFMRLPIDRAFSMKGFGPVVTGTLVSGSIAVGDDVELFPGKRRVRVRGLHSGGTPVERATAGQRTAVNLGGIELEKIGRGMTLAAPKGLEPTAWLDARIALLGSAPILRDRAKVHFHQGTAECIAEIHLLESKQLESGDSAFARLKLSRAVFVFPGDRFILRQFSPVITIGGGKVLDAHPRRPTRRAADALKLLRVLDAGSREEKLNALVNSESRGLDLAQLVVRTGWSESDLRELAVRLAAAGKLKIIGNSPLTVVSSDSFEFVRTKILREVKEFHRLNPLDPGMPKEVLKGKLPRGNHPELFREALESMLADHALAVTGDLVARAGLQLDLLPEERAASAAIEAAFAAEGLNAPGISEVLGKASVEPKRAQKLLQLLVREGRLVRVNEGLIFHRDALKKLSAIITDHKLRQGARLTIAAFKEMTGVSRKYAIPLLEYLDREKITRRAGDERVIL